MRKQEAARRREERDKEEERQKRRSELKHRDEVEARAKESLGVEARRGRGMRENQEDRAVGHRLSNFLPPAHRLSRRREDEAEESLGETTVIDAEQVKEENKRPGLRNSQLSGSSQGLRNNQLSGSSQGLGNNQLSGSSQGFRSNQLSGSSQGLGSNQLSGSNQGFRNNQVSGNINASINRQAEEKRLELDKSLGLEPYRESGESQKQKQETYNRSKKKDRGGRRRGSR
jgi:hypothetical protein